MAEDAVILLLEGTPIGEWRVVKPHRIGGSGTVYRVRRDGTSGPDYALKLRNRGTAVCTREEFQRELRILRDRKLGVNQPAFLGCGEYEGEPYFVMEFAEMIRPGMNPGETYWFFRGIAEGLLRLNAEFLFHGDIKDVNLGICGAFPKRRPVLLDFGSVRPWVRNLEDPIATTESMLHEDVKETGLYTFLDDLRALAQVMQKYCKDEARARYSEAIEGALRKNESATYTSTKDFIAALDACHKKSLYRTIGIRTMYSVAVVALIGVLLAFGLRALFHRESSVSEDVRYPASAKQASLALEENSVRGAKPLSNWVDTATATPAQAEAWVEEGRKLYEQNHFAEALACFEKAVRTPGFESGYAYGKIAECYYWGRGCPQNKPIGLRFAKYAAELNEPSGKKLLDSFGKN